MFRVTGSMVSMGRAMDRISQVPPESTRHGAEASIPRFLSILLADEDIERERLPNKTYLYYTQVGFTNCVAIFCSPVSRLVESFEFSSLEFASDFGLPWRDLVYRFIKKGTHY
jgi:hypothetical protein